MDDWELVYMYQQNSELVLELAINKYRNLIYNMIYQFCMMYNIMDNSEELFQIATIKLAECFNTMRYDKMAQFSTFYKRVLKNAIIDYERNRIRNRVIYLDLDEENNVVNEVNKAYHIKTKQQDNIHDQVIGKVSAEMFTNNLSSRESKILELKQMGYKHREIAKLLNMSVSNVNYVLSNIRNRFKNCEIKIDE